MKYIHVLYHFIFRATLFFPILEEEQLALKEDKNLWRSHI